MLALPDHGADTLGHQFAVVSDQRRDGVRVIAGDLLHDLHERPVRDAFAVRKAAADDEAAFSATVDQLPDEA